MFPVSETALNAADPAARKNLRDTIVFSETSSSFDGISASTVFHT
jgi:hypothetical protein